MAIYKVNDGEANTETESRAYIATIVYPRHFLWHRFWFISYRCRERSSREDIRMTFWLPTKRLTQNGNNKIWRTYV